MQQVHVKFNVSELFVRRNLFNRIGSSVVLLRAGGLDINLSKSNNVRFLNIIYGGFESLLNTRSKYEIGISGIE